jgi:hypothetical protein
VTILLTTYAWGQLHGRQAVCMRFSYFCFAAHRYFRNAAKARVKDSTGRIQKVFFGRRRLDLLSKGITNNLRESSYHGKGSKLTSLSIDLAHSKQTTEISSRHDGQSFIHSPTRFFSSTPGTRRSGLRTGQQCSSGSSSSQCSKVIDALDTSDRE